MCLNVCVLEREKERERERECYVFLHVCVRESNLCLNVRVRDRKRERESVCECVDKICSFAFYTLTNSESLSCVRKRGGDEIDG